VTGIDTFGRLYRAVGMHYHTGTERDENPPLNPDGPFHWAIMQNFYVIGEGQAPDFKLHLLVRVTFNANGELRGFVDQFRVTCQ
jgi:hypothetical protein